MFLVPLPLGLADTAKSPLPTLNSEVMALMCAMGIITILAFFVVEQIGQNLMLEVNFQPMEVDPVSVFVFFKGDFRGLDHDCLSLVGSLGGFLVKQREVVPVDESGDNHQKAYQKAVKPVPAPKGRFQLTTRPFSLAVSVGKERIPFSDLL